MNDEKGRDKMDLIVQICKENYKMCKAMVQYFSQRSVDVDKKFQKIEKQIDSVKEDIHQLDKLRADDRHVYTDEELAKLKISMSWNELHLKTKIPVSTLQYRCRRYKGETGTTGGIQ